MRILICRSNPVAPDPRVEKSACALADAGHDIKIISWDRSGSQPSHAILSNRVEIYRIPIKAGYSKGIRNLPQLLRWQLSLFTWMIRKRFEFDYIHACDFDTVIPSLFLKWITKKKLVYDIFDFYTDHISHTPACLKGIIRVVDLWIIGKADAVILVDDSRRVQITGSKPKSLTIIYNVPEERFATLERLDAFSSASARLRIAYVGLFLPGHGLFELIEVLRRHPEWQLALAGFGAMQEEILNAADGLRNVHWLGRVPHQKALSVTSSADVVFAMYDPAIRNHKYASPNKVFEAMMMGKPVIVARNTNVDLIVEQYQFGLVADYGNLRQLEESLAKLDANPEMRRSMGENARRAYDEKYNWGEMRRRLLDLYAHLGQ